MVIIIRMNTKIAYITSAALLSVAFLSAHAMDMIDASSTMMKKDMKDAGMHMMKDDMMSSSDSLPASDLSFGDRGEMVVQLQKYLVGKGYLVMPEGAAYGYFGALTKRALMSYQTSLGVKGTGYFGHMTRSKSLDMMKMKSSMKDGDTSMMKGDMMKKDMAQ